MKLLRKLAALIGLKLVFFSREFTVTAPEHEGEAVWVHLDSTDEFAIVKAKTYTRRVLPKVGNVKQN